LVCGRRKIRIIRRPLTHQYLDRRSGDRRNRGDQRGVFVPFICDSLSAQVDGVAIPGGRLAGILLGFLHSNYPQEPGYIRGIEVGLIGIVAGMVMLRWGIVATLIWHYTVDASLVGMLLIALDNLYFKIFWSGCGAGSGRSAGVVRHQLFARGRFEPVDDLLNGAEAVPGDQPGTSSRNRGRAAIGTAVTALTAGAIGFLALCLLVGGCWRGASSAKVSEII